MDNLFGDAKGVFERTSYFVCIPLRMGQFDFDLSFKGCILNDISPENDYKQGII